MRYFHFCAHEQFPPDDLLRQAVEAERAGFDGIGCSDHLQPWSEDGESDNAWIWLGAAAQATEKVPLGTGVTPLAPLPPGADRPGLGDAGDDVPGAPLSGGSAPARR